MPTEDAAADMSAMDVTEHPCKIHVIVTTNKEEELQKLRALDPIGAEVIEITYLLAVFHICKLTCRN